MIQQCVGFFIPNFSPGQPGASKMKEGIGYRLKGAEFIKINIITETEKEEKMKLVRFFSLRSYLMNNVLRLILAKMPCFLLISTFLALLIVPVAGTAADPTGGSISGESGVWVICKNKDTGQTVFKLLGGATSWDCEAEGLIVNPGDKIIQLVTGAAETASDCTPPPYNPEKWVPPAQYDNNCYNYANDERTDTFAQPGKAHGCYPYPLSTCADVYAAAQCDGLVPIASGTSPTPDDMHRVYLMVWPGYDYHWYRQDIPNGMWSHKPGSTPVTDRDSSGALIYNPDTADTGPYTLRCGYMAACGDNADIQ